MFIPAAICREEFRSCQPDKLAAYFRNFPPETGIEALLRWEDGKIHPLPQDFADMLGWDELGNIVIRACDTIADKEQDHDLCENYGQAGAIDHYTEGHGLPGGSKFLRQLFALDSRFHC